LDVKLSSPAIKKFLLQSQCFVKTYAKTSATISDVESSYKTIIPLVPGRYEVITANATVCTLLVIYHFVYHHLSNTRLWNNY